MQDLRLQLPLTVRVDDRRAGRDGRIARVLRYRRRPHTDSSNRKRGPAAAPVTCTASPASAGQLYAEFSGTARCWIHAVSGIWSHTGGHVSRLRVCRYHDDKGHREATGDQHRREDHPHRHHPRQGTIVDMQLTHFGHSCLLAEFGNTRLLFDPGTFAHGFEGITGLSAIVITHQHPDHVDVTRLPSLLEGNPSAALVRGSANHRRNWARHARRSTSATHCRSGS